MAKKDIGNWKLNSQIIHSGSNPDSEYGSVSPPIYQTSTFEFKNTDQGAARFAGKEDGFIYSRLGNPTVASLEQALTSLEHGVGGLATSTGMAAISTLYFAVMGNGSHMVGTDALYGSSRVIMEKEFSRFGCASDFVDTSNPDELERHMQENTKLVLLESPGNPTLKLTDIKVCSEIAHKYGAVVAVDNTFMSPVLQNPLDLGADIVMHSLTKYINGHTDVVGGALIAKDPEIFSRLSSIHKSFGTTMDPNQAWLILRGLRTMGLRVERAMENAQILASFLEDHPKVKWVNYPGLPSNPQYDLAKKQMKGPGSMISFEIEGGLKSGKLVMDNVALATLAVSLGGFETLIEHPASMTHASVPKKDREECGITDGLVRLAVGCEDVIDIQQDLEHCLSLI